MDDQLRYKQDLLNAHRKRLQLLELQGAKYGIDAKPEVVIEIEEIKQKVQDLELELLTFGRLERLRFLASEILNYARNSLAENQDVLNDYFQDKANQAKYYDRMFRLYSDQQNHGNYESWIASLSITLDRESDPILKQSVKQLQNLVYSLREAFYSQTPNHKGNFKLNVVRVLNPRANYREEQIIYTAQKYLDLLRELVGEIGYVHGILTELTR